VQHAPSDGNISSFGVENCKKAYSFSLNREADPRYISRFSSLVFDLLACLVDLKSARRTLKKADKVT